MNQRRQSQVFGEVADLYHRHRPRYPDDLYETIAYAAHLPEHAVVADVGCGTGISSGWFVDAGHDVLGVEPDAAMAAVAERELTGRGRFTVFAGSLQEWAPPSDGVDLIVSGQAWHWMDPETRFDTAAQALAPRRGSLAVFWNRPEPSQIEWFEEIHAVYRHHLPDFGDARVKMASPGRKAAVAAATPTDEFEHSGRFGPVVEWSRGWERTVTTEEHVQTLLTQSDHRMLPASVLAALLHDVRAVIDRHGASYQMPYTVHAYIARVR